jgi:hypothetical protein
VNLANDLDIFFADLAEPALVGTATVKVLFNEPSTTLAGLGVGIGSTLPTAIMKQQDLLDLEIDSGTVITIRGVDYLVLGSPDHDGMGLTSVALEVT